jgi:hypothetical protein
VSRGCLRHVLECLSHQDSVQGRGKFIYTYRKGRCSRSSSRWFEGWEFLGCTLVSIMIDLSPNKAMVAILQRFCLDGPKAPFHLQGNGVYRSFVSKTSTCIRCRRIHHQHSGIILKTVEVHGDLDWQGRSKEWSKMLSACLMRSEH